MTFRTTCTDDTGATHVLEHMSLGGSKHFPIRSIFSELHKRSMAVFMNALTSIEWTAYPFSTTNEKDFHNLLDVYMDAVFHPLLDEKTFEYECHHLEFEVFDDPNTSLKHSGVVYNEMNGVFSNPSERFSSLVRGSLYPDSVFGLEYGGNPEDIAKLTLADVKRRHQMYYHPSNSLFFHYGSFDTDAILEKVASVIEGTGYEKGSIVIPEDKIEQKRWTDAKFVTKEGPAGDDPTKVRVGAAWIVGDLRNVSEIIDLNFLSMLLTHSSASPLYKALIKSGFGSEFIETGLLPYMRTPYFSVGLEGVDEKAAGSFWDTLLATLNDIYTNGFEKERIEGLLHREEMSLKEVSSRAGMSLWEWMIGSWIHGVSPLDLLDVQWELDRIRKILRLQPRYFEILMKKKLIDNTHRLVLTMKGVKGFQEQYSAKIKEELSKMKEQMNEQQKTDLVEKAKEIRKTIDSPKPVHLLPEIRVSEIEPSIPPVEYNKDGSVFTFERPTNGIVYVRIKSELPLSVQGIEDFGLLPHFMHRLGAAEYDDEGFTKECELVTGGIECYTVIERAENGQARAYLVVSGSALERNARKLLDLMMKVIQTPHLDNKQQIGVVLTQMAATIAADVLSSGHSFAFRRSCAEFSDCSLLKELWSGVSFLKKVHQMAKDKKWDDVAAKLVHLHENIYKKGVFSASIHGPSSVIKELSGTLKSHMNSLNSNSLPNQGVASLVDLRKQYQRDTLLYLDSSTYFCALSYLYLPDSGPASVTASIFQNEFLFESLREKLGAYSAMSSYESSTGTMSLLSYRDTSPALILEAMNDTVTKVSEGGIDQGMVDRAIVRVISGMDAPVSPGGDGLGQFWNEMAQERKQKMRTSILATTVEDVRKVAEQLKKSQPRVSIVGGKGSEVLPKDLFVVDILE